ncbi:MAG: M48 family metallopeptidase [Bacteroidales bacterium]|nr:M48 family metallopeptidase [Candidatus Physcocola equi]
MYTTLFYLIIALLVAEFLLDSYLDYKNRQASTSPIPDELKGIYDDEKYEKEQQYFIAKDKFGTIQGAFSLIVILLMFTFFGFGFVDNLARTITGYTNDGLWLSIATGLLFLGILYYADEIINIPFSAYYTFSIEERFGFNKMTPALFVKDMIKEWLLNAVLGAVIIGLLMLLYEETGEYFWVLGWGVMSAFSIIAMMFYTSLILPLFNKLTPLEDGELRTAIEDFCKKVDFKLENLYIMDNSKRSTKANAFFSGLGNKKKIVLFDTLISNFTKEEIVAVLAHEVGHYKCKHTRKMLLLNLLSFGLMFFILSLFFEYKNEIATTLYGQESTNGSFWLSIIVFSVLYTPISTITSVLVNILSRKNEYEADAFAKKEGVAEHLISALKKLTASSLSNLTPHPYYIFFHFSHPTLLQRVRALKK